MNYIRINKILRVHETAIKKNYRKRRQTTHKFLRRANTDSEGNEPAKVDQKGQR